MVFFIAGLLLALLVRPTPVFAGGVSNSIFNNVGAIFGASSGSPAGATDLGTLIVNIVTILLVVAGSIAVIFLIIGGFRYVTASGNEEQTEAAKKTMTGAIIGLAVILLSFAIIRIISTILLTGSTGI